MLTSNIILVPLEFGYVKLLQKRFLLELGVCKWVVGTIGRLVFGFLAMALKDFTCLEFLGKDKKIFTTPSCLVARV